MWHKNFPSKERKHLKYKLIECLLTVALSFAVKPQLFMAPTAQDVGNVSLSFCSTLMLLCKIKPADLTEAHSCCQYPH